MLQNHAVNSMRSSVSIAYAHGEPARREYLQVELSSHAPHPLQAVAAHRRPACCHRQGERNAERVPEVRIDGDGVVVVAQHW